MLDRVFDSRRLGVNVRAGFALPALIREMRVDRGQLVIVQ